MIPSTCLDCGKEQCPKLGKGYGSHTCKGKYCHGHKMKMTTLKYTNLSKEEKEKFLLEITKQASQDQRDMMERAKDTRGYELEALKDELT